MGDTTKEQPADVFGRKRAWIVLEDGSEWHGYSFGAPKSVDGEVVFQTGMVGYVESLTDPSYHKQLLTLTYPLVGNYGVPGDEFDEYGIPKYFERDRIYARALIVSTVAETHSHWNAKRSLSEWMAEQGVPGITGIDTRALTKHIRSKGAMLGKLIVEGDTDLLQRPLEDPNKANLVAEVSTKSVVEYNKGGKPSVLAIDCGMKNNQIREFVKRGCHVTVVPWNHPLLPLLHEHDGLFISNGPGDPLLCQETIANIRQVIALEPPKPVFGICLGNQLLALASGARTYKLPFGNRGHNIPAINIANNRCYITTQNHGFAVDSKSLGADWAPLFINANDFTNEGIIHRTKPFFSVQFHPEARAGPEDTMFLFDTFITSFTTGKTLDPPKTNELPESLRLGTRINHGLSKVVVVGSGGLSIGQAGEFDYSGSQALKALKEEGVYTVLVNPNIATVQTSKGLASKVYYVPITPEFVTKVLEQERPDGILLNFGGQTALNCGVEMYKSGVFERLGVRVLGTSVDTIIKTEDRQLFAAELEKINEPIARSASATTTEEAVAAAAKIGYPVIVRAAFALGGLGSGFANTSEELEALCDKAFSVSPQVLVERSMKGWKEIEYEVVRDQFDNCITVCNMENFDPLGVHTGDSIVVAPSQTLSDKEYQMLRTCAIKVVRHLGVVGECNIQYALNPESLEYCIIEVNARLSRSSALASKATGYPLAFVAAKLSIGMPLPAIRNSVTKDTTACFEPSLDYVVLKMPRWDLQKFGVRVSKHISSAMKSVGEVMSIGRTFEEAMQKAMRMVTDYKALGFTAPSYTPSDEALANPTDERIFYLAAAFEHGASVEHVHALTRIDAWFLSRLKGMSDLANLMRTYSLKMIPREMLLTAKQRGFSDRQLSRMLASTQSNVRAYRESIHLMPVVRQIDTVAAEFPAKTNYLYMTYTGNALHDVEPEEDSVLVLGSGAYRIGSSVEFDWCAVSCIRTLAKIGHRSIMLNCNPETVSTDYDECHRLYFDEESLERVLDVYAVEKAGGVVVSVGGQVPNNLAIPLHRAHVNVIGTSPEMIDCAENRYKFSRMLDKLKGVDQPQWKEATSMDEAKKFCESVGYPVLVRPSYVLSGAAMNVAYSHSDLQQMLTEAATVSQDCPVVVSKFIMGAKEIEIDAVARDGEIVVAAISEHVENAGVHSGDATLVLPAQDLSQETINTVVDSARKIIASLQVTGPVNIQFLAKDNEVKVIECNLRASRSFPFASKTVDRDFIEIATKVMMGHEAGYTGPEVFGSSDALRRVGVKVSQFSFPRLSGADPVLGVEMASTGEVACFGRTREEAYLKALLSSGFVLPSKVILLSIGSFKDKSDFLESARQLAQMKFHLLGTRGTAEYFQEHGINVKGVDLMLNDDMAEGNDPNEEIITNLIRSNKISLIINTPSLVRYRRQSSFGYRIRRLAVDFSVPLLVNIKCAKLVVSALLARLWDAKASGTEPVLKGIELSRYDFVSSNETVMLPAIVDLRAQPAGSHPKDMAHLTRSALAQGVTVLGVLPDRFECSDSTTLKQLQSCVHSNAYCDVIPWIGATPTNVVLVESLSPFVAGLVATPQLNPGTASSWLEHINSWPSHVPVVVDASVGGAAEAVLLASLAGRPIHMSNISTALHISLIKTCKAKGVQITCDMSPHHLFVCQGQPGTGTDTTGLGTANDMNALWANLDVVDCFASAPEPYTLGNTLPLLLDAVHNHQLSVARLIELVHTNPSALFDLPKQHDTYIEVDLDERWTGLSGLPHLTGRSGFGRVRRVVVRDTLAAVSGTVTVDQTFGRLLHRVSAPSEEVIDASAPPRSRVDPTRKLAMDTMSPGFHPVAPKDEAQLASLVPLALSPSTKHHVTPTLSFTALPQVAISASQSATSSVSGVLGHVSLGLRKPSEVAVGTSEPSEANSWFKNKSILSVAQFSKEPLRRLFEVAREMHAQSRRKSIANLLQGRILGCLFFEPSTRTQLSFETAMKRLGGQVMTLDSHQSMMSRGESLHDTIRMVDGYADVLILRHPHTGSVANAAKLCAQPVINAGDGEGEHPTQALVDLYTIIEEKGTVNGLAITLTGDLAHSRAAHSLVRALVLYDVRLHFVSPPGLELPKEILSIVASRGIEFHSHTSLDPVIGHTDVLYVTPFKKELFASTGDYESKTSAFRITLDVLRRARENMILMHALPRFDEISDDVDGDPRAVYFRQAQYAVFVRMALLALVMGKVK